MHGGGGLRGLAKVAMASAVPVPVCESWAAGVHRVGRAALQAVAGGRRWHAAGPGVR